MRFLLSCCCSLPPLPLHGSNREGSCAGVGACEGSERTCCCSLGWDSGRVNSPLGREGGDVEEEGNRRGLGSLTLCFCSSWRGRNSNCPVSSLRVVVPVFHESEVQVDSAVFIQNDFMPEVSPIMSHPSILLDARARRFMSQWIQRVSLVPHNTCDHRVCASCLHSKEEVRPVSSPVHGRVVFFSQSCILQRADILLFFFSHVANSTILFALHLLLPSLRCWLRTSHTSLVHTAEPIAANTLAVLTARPLSLAKAAQAVSAEAEGLLRLRRPQHVREDDDEDAATEPQAFSHLPLLLRLRLLERGSLLREPLFQLCLLLGILLAPLLPASHLDP
mmetsp:Transcript_50332/g.157209  ORF Transcript_50332/g.157209 Transcript_50332/m.157209 type:complete len:334 (-) Transcript_50332:7-1008(-)